MSIYKTYPSASAVAQVLGICEREAPQAASIHFIFNQFSKQSPDNSSRQRMKHAFDSSIAHVAMRIGLLDGYEPTFFSANENYSHDAIAIATLCSPFLKNDSGAKDFNAAGPSPRITDEIIKRAYLLQEEAMEIKKAADIDHKGLRADNDCFSRAAYFLAFINLFEKMYKIESSDASDESLSDHLRYDLVCASRYVNRNTLFGRAIADAVDIREGEIVEHLKLLTRVHPDTREDDGPKLNFS